MKIVQKIATNNPCYRAGKTIVPKGLMLHSVGTPQPDAMVFVNNWSKSTAEVCVHAVLQADGTVYQLLPWNWRAWHCGGSGNNTHIGVEMTEPANIRYTGGATFTVTDKNAAKKQVQGTYETAVELFAQLCKEFGLDPLTQITSHAEGYQKGIASNHADPEHLWRQLGLSYTLNSFRQDVKTKMSGAGQSNSTIKAIDALANLGVINTPEYWYAHYGDLKYLDALLQKAATALTVYGKPVASVPEALEKLKTLGVIDTPTYWSEHFKDVKYLDLLLLAMGGCSGYTEKQFIQDIQAAIGVGVDGIAGTVTLEATPTVSSEKNNRHVVIPYLQKYLYVLGYVEVGTADGVAGTKFDQAVRNFQANNGCVIDGEITAGAETWRKLLGME